MSKLEVFVKTNIEKAVQALADVASAVASLKIETGLKTEETMGIENEVLALGYKIFLAGMGVRREDEPTAVDESKPQPGVRSARKTEKATPRAAKATPNVAQAEAKGDGKKKAKGYSAMGVCAICGKSYLKRSPIQKTCSPECTTAKNRAYARAKYAGTEGAAQPKDRLNRIKEIDKKLDNIPE